MTENNLDGLLLAQAGLERLGLAGEITEVLDPAWMLPAVGQGALGLECRTEDKESGSLAASINHPPTAWAVLAERAMLRELGGGCHVPIGAATLVHGANLTMRGVVLSPDGKRRIEGLVSGPALTAEALGRQLAKELWAGGAGDLLSRPC